MRSVTRKSLALAMIVASGGMAQADSLKVLHRFADTGTSASHYALGANPDAELLQASDGNFYGTTFSGGSYLCPNGSAGMSGCGTIFRMTPQGEVTTLYSFPYDTETGTAPNGAFPTAGLIQAADGYLYGVAQDGGVARCNGVLGCGTLFRISTSGVFKLLHQFCSGDGCQNPSEGGRPMAHLVQTANRALCGTTAEGGYENEGTVFCASTDGGIDTRYVFQYENGTDGYNPIGALLVGPDGRMLYGMTEQGGVNGGGAGGGTVFALRGTHLTVLHAFDDSRSSTPGTYYYPVGAPIFGADGNLYGVLNSGGSGGGIFSMNTDGTGFAAQNVFTQASNVPSNPAAGLVLARNGLMYGTTQFGSIEKGSGQDNGVVYSYNPVDGAFRALVDFTAPTGDFPRAALIEGADKYLYTTTPADGGSNKRGQDQGTALRLSPALKQ